MLQYCRNGVVGLMAGAILVVLQMVLSASAFAANDARDKHLTSAATRPESITVVVASDYPPYSIGSGAVLQGILKDNWDLWSARTGITVNLQAIDWAKAQQAVLEGRADVIDMFFYTSQRAPFYDYTKPFARIQTPLFFHSSVSGIVDADSLQGFTVGVVDGDACVEELQKHNVVNLKKYSSSETLVRAAARQEIRVFCNDKPPTMYHLHKFGIESEFRQSAPLYVGEFHRAVRKGNSPMLKIVEDGFGQISDPELKRIEDKWFGAPLLSHKTLEMVRKIGTAVAVFVVLTLSLFSYWNRSLRKRVSAKTDELSRTLSELREAKKVAEKTLNSLAATLEAIPDLLFEMDLSGRYISYRSAVSDLLATQPEHMVGCTVSGVMPPGEASVVLGALQEAAAKGHSRGAQIRLEMEGRSYWFELSVACKKTNPDEDKRFIVLSRDITERKNAELEIEKLAFFDPLTLLPNRRFLLDRLQRGLASSERRGNNGAIFFVDLDNFKTLNDTQGHRLGDLLLVEVAKRLRHCVRLEDCIARLGGDEFVVLLEDLSIDLNEAAAAAESIGQKILDEIGKTYLLDGFEYHCSASVGVTLFSGRGDDVDELLKRADAAMYRSKAAGRNTLRFFDPAMQANLEARAVLEAELRRALPEQQLELFYQVQVDGSMRIIGAELLLRWRHPVRGLIVPMQFIPLAEESGLIVPIGHWVLEAACDQLKRWDESPQTRKLHLSVNVSARQFRQQDFVQRVKSIIHSSGIDPSRLILELTESLVLDNVVDSIDKMYSLKLLGVRFSMDDFGTGYSSLAYLKRLPLDQLKIDRSFVRDIDTDPGDAVIVRTIIDMARNFGLEVVAEGVENDAQRAFLLANGCMEFQGYLFSRPVPLPEFEALLNRDVSRSGAVATSLHHER